MTVAAFIKHEKNNIMSNKTEFTGHIIAPHIMEYYILNDANGYLWIWKEVRDIFVGWKNNFKEVISLISISKTKFIYL